MQMLIMTTLVDEVKVNAERTNLSRLLYKILLLLIHDAFYVKFVKLGDIILANKVLSSCKRGVSPNTISLMVVQKLT
jgi:hypothetical protein